MFNRLRPQTKRASFSSSSNPVSPIQGSFNFELSPSPLDAAPPSPFSPVSESSISRPRTSHGLPAGDKSRAGSSLQLLPPIPRVASRGSSLRSTEDMDAEGGSESAGVVEGGVAKLHVAASCLARWTRMRRWTGIRRLHADRRAPKVVAHGATLVLASFHCFGAIVASLSIVTRPLILMS